MALHGEKQKMSTIRAIQTGPVTDDLSVNLPHNIEAEQQLLGAILTNNELFDRVAGIVKAEHFHEPVHARIWEKAAAQIAKNALASPVTLKLFLEDDEGLKELGGPAYLARIAGSAVSSFAARDYAQIVHDLAVRRELIQLGREISDRAARVDVAGEPKEQIVEAEQRLYALAEQGSQQSRGFQSLPQGRDRRGPCGERRLPARRRASPGSRPGLVDLDRKLGGLHRSDLLILAGRPSMGKTSLATNIAFNIAKAYRRGRRPDGSEGAVNGGVVGFFSLEMSAEQLAARVLSEAAEVPSEQIRRGDMTEGEFRRFVDAAKTLESCPLFIDDTPALPISQLAARARRLKRTHGLDALFVDYLQLVKPATAKDSRVQRGLRDHARPQGHRQGTRHPRGRPLPALPPGREPRGQAPAARPTCANPARSSRTPTS